MSPRFETYVRGKEAKLEASAAARWAEVRLGELLGEAKRDHDRRPGAMSNAFDIVSRDERVWFRRMAG